VQFLAVPAQKIGHSRLKHIRTMLPASFAQTGIMFFILSMTFTNRSPFQQEILHFGGGSLHLKEKVVFSHDEFFRREAI
jgi:hypothetical protein